MAWRTLVPLSFRTQKQNARIGRHQRRFSSNKYISFHHFNTVSRLSRIHHLARNHLFHLRKFHFIFTRRDINTYKHTRLYFHVNTIARKSRATHSIWNSPISSDSFDMYQQLDPQIFTHFYLPLKRKSARLKQQQQQKKWNKIHYSPLTSFAIHINFMIFYQ